MDGKCLLDDYKEYLRLEWVSEIFVKRKVKSPRNSKRLCGPETFVALAPRILISGICECVHRVQRGQITY